MQTLLPSTFSTSSSLSCSLGLTRVLPMTSRRRTSRRVPPDCLAASPSPLAVSAASSPDFLTEVTTRSSAPSSAAFRSSSSGTRLLRLLSSRSSAPSPVLRTCPSIGLFFLCTSAPSSLLPCAARFSESLYFDGVDRRLTPQAHDQVPLHPLGSRPQAALRWQEVKESALTMQATSVCPAEKSRRDVPDVGQQIFMI